MLLSDLIAPDSVEPLLKAKSKKQLLQELSARAAPLTGLPERDIFEGGDLGKKRYDEATVSVM